MLSGGCFCGRVRYEIRGEPFHETICHCGDCRRAVGATAVPWFSVRRDAFRLTADEPASFRSSPKAVRQFCGVCGTSLLFLHEEKPDEMDVTVGSLDDPDAAAPKDHTRAGGRPSWEAIPDGLPVHPGARDAG